MTRTALAGATALAIAGAAAAPAANAAPRFDQLVVFRSGEAKQGTVGTRAVRARVGDRRCRVPRATPLAALVRSRVGRLRLRDFSGSCDPSSLFVRAIGPDVNRGQSGWVYKVGNRQGTTAASDPSGPFGSGRLRRRARITWFYCVFRTGGCQRTLGLRTRDEGGGTVTVRVTAHDDEGRGERAARATVHADGRSVQTDPNGVATLTLSAGTHRVYAEKRRHIRSFTERVRVG
jgi:hypothetical protein